MVSTFLHLIWGYILSRFLEVSLIPTLILSQILDLDFAIGFIKNNPHDHRYYFHNVFSVFIITYMSTLFLPPIAAIAIAVHLFFDLIDGDGVPLFYPMSKRKYLLFRIGKEGILFPTKLFWEGNKYLSMFSLIMVSVFYIIRGMV